MSVQKASKSPVAAASEKPPQPILFQTYFKSKGPRTYAAQLKKAGNGNHFLVLTEGRRDPETKEVKKTRLYLFSEDFPEFFRMMHEVAVHVREHPVPANVATRQAKRWAKQATSNTAPGTPTQPKAAGAPRQAARAARLSPATRAA